MMVSVTLELCTWLSGSVLSLGSHTLSVQFLGIFLQRVSSGFSSFLLPLTNKLIVGLFILIGLIDMNKCMSGWSPIQDVFLPHAQYFQPNPNQDKGGIDMEWFIKLALASFWLG